QVIDGTGRGGKMQDIVHLSRYMDKGRNIVVVELKAFQVEEVFYVPKVPRDQIVHSDDMMAFGYETIAKVGTQKSCCSCDEGFFHKSWSFFYYGSCFLSIGFGLSPDRIENGLYYNLKIEEHGPVLDIEDIEFYSVMDVIFSFNLPPIPPYLRQTCYAGLYKVPDHVFVHTGGILIGVFYHMGPGTHYGHGPKEYIVELGQFINTCLADELTDFCDPHIVFCGLDFIRILIGGHGAALITAEFPVVQSISGLAKKDGAP